jgi:hypothetical protein
MDRLSEGMANMYASGGAVLSPAMENGAENGKKQPPLISRDLCRGAKVCMMFLTYIHTYVNTYVHTYYITHTHTFIHTYTLYNTHTHIYIYIYTYITYIHTCMEGASSASATNGY